MHLCLLGWVKLLLTLLTGSHSKTQRLGSPYVLSKTSQTLINEALNGGAGGIPGSWGRAPLSLDSLSHFKAEDFKSFGLFHGKILFHGLTGLGKKETLLWSLTATMLEIVFDPTPNARD